MGCCNTYSIDNVMKTYDLRQSASVVNSWGHQNRPLKQLDDLKEILVGSVTTNPTNYGMPGKDAQYSSNMGLYGGSELERASYAARPTSSGTKGPYDSPFS